MTCTEACGLDRCMSVVDGAPDLALGWYGGDQRPLTQTGADAPCSSRTLGHILRSFHDSQRNHSARARAWASSDGGFAAEPTRRDCRTIGRPATVTNVAAAPAPEKTSAVRGS
jgi:hypothetical protein